MHSVYKKSSIIVLLFILNLVLYFFTKLDFSIGVIFSVILVIVLLFYGVDSANYHSVIIAICLVMIGLINFMSASSYNIVLVKLILFLFSCAMIMNLNETLAEKMARAMVFFIIINCFIQLYAMFTNNMYLKIDFSGERYGYNGLLPISANESIYLIIMAQIVVFEEFRRSKINKSQFLIFSFFTIISLVLTAQKTAFFFAILSFVYVLLKFSTILSLASFSLILGYITYYSFDFTSLKLLSYYFGQLKHKELIYVLFSGRNERLEENIVVGLTGSNRDFVNFEMDFFTALHNFGVPFAVLLILFLGYTILRKSEINFPSFLFVIMLFFGLFLSGHLFVSTFLLVPLVVTAKILQASITDA